jgi:hypothetical protein
MSSLQTLVDLFKTTPTLANAKKVVAKNVHSPMAICMLSGDDAIEVARATRLLDDAKNPAKVKEAMQAELRARFKGMNIEVI